MCFFLKKTTELSHSDATRFSCNFISDGVPLLTYLKWYFTLLTKSFILFNNYSSWHKNISCDFFHSLSCIATLKACSACFTAFLLWNLCQSSTYGKFKINPVIFAHVLASLKCSKALQKLVKHNNLLWFHCTCFSIHQGPAVWLQRFSQTCEL